MAKLRANRARRLALVALAVAVPVAAAVWLGGRALVDRFGRARDLHGVAHVGSDICAACHPDQAKSWRRTFHRTMTQEARDQAGDRRPTVAGDFSGAIYRYGGVVARMDRDPDGRYRMTFTRSSDGHRSEAIVVRTVGSRRYQQYLAEFGGALWRLPMAYHIEERRWFHMNGAFAFADPTTADRTTPDSDSRADRRPTFGGGEYDRHVTRWNDNCVFCHNVAPNPGRKVGTAGERFDTKVAELGIACEACHGPGAEHVSHNQNALRRLFLRLSAGRDGSIVNPGRLSSQRSADVCGRCHGQRITDDVAPFLTHGDPFVPGDDLALYSSPLWHDTTLAGQPRAFAARFWNDGTARLTAYEYQGLLQSACATRGSLTCTSCHGMHGANPRGQVRSEARGDMACTQCHVALSDAAAVAQHTRHNPAAAGARCLDCHMPRIVYGVLAIHRSHRIERPDPARDAAMGRPDACTLCHVDRSRTWAVQKWRELWPGARDRHLAAHSEDRADSAASGGAPGTPNEPQGPSAAMVSLFAGDAVERAVAAAALGSASLGARQPTVSAEGDVRQNLRVGALVEAMAGDSYPAVRRIAARAAMELLPAGGSAAAVLRRFDATAAPEDRAAVVDQLRRAADWHGQRPGASSVAALRANARQVDIEIGE